VVIRAIQALCAGEVWARRSDLRRALRHLHPGEVSGKAGPELTRRELEVLHLLAEGMPTGEVARALFISASTVRVHTSRILEKLGVRNRIGAVRAAVRKGLVNA
jgi:DNA-binding NarL/FixJ family response regulator